MSKDKLKGSLSYLPEYSVGEQPTAIKLNYSFKVFKDALNYIEMKIGDLGNNNNSYSLLSEKPLLINNIGRYLGPTYSMQPSANVDEEYTFSSELYKNINEWTLPVWPYGTDVTTRKLALSLNGAKDSAGNDLFQTEVAYPTMPSSSGEWCYDTKNNKIISFNIFNSGTATAMGTSCHQNAYIFGDSAQFYFLGDESLNVIPSFQNTQCTAITVGSSVNPLFDYEITINEDDYIQNGPVSNTDGSKSDINTLRVAYENNEAGANSFPNITSKVQHTLPYSLNSFSSGDLLPESYVYLYDDANNLLYESGSYYYKDQTSFYYKGASLNTDSTSHYRVVTAGGVDIATKTEGLAFTLKHHKHVGPEAISHKSLLNSLYIPYNGLPSEISTDLSNGYNRQSIPVLHNNPHPQYLSRNGYDYKYDKPNFSNTMMGDLAFSQKVSDVRNASFDDAWGQADKESWGLNFADKAWTSLKYTPTGKLFLETKSENIVELSQKYNLSPQMISVTNDNNNIRVVSQDYNVIASGYNSIVDVVGSSIASSIIESTSLSHYIVGDSNKIESTHGINSNVSIVGVGSTASGTNFESLNLKVVGNKTNITYDNCKDSDVLVVSRPVDTGIQILDTSIVKNGTIYRKAYNIIEDAEVREVTRPITPNMVMLVRGDSYGRRVYSQDTTNLTNGGPVADHTVGQLVGDGVNRIYANAFSTTDNDDFLVYLGLESDSSIDKIQIYLSYYEAEVSLYYFTIEGFLTKFYTNNLASSDGATRVLVTLNPNGAFGTKGSRFPSRTGDAIDIVLRVNNNSSDPANTTPLMAFYGGTYKYYRMRM